MAKAIKESGNFASKAHDMIERCSVDHPEIASWTSKGDTFFVHDTPELERTYLPQYFGHSNFKTFQRQLNLYGFRNATKALASDNAGSIAGNHKKGIAYQHQHFLRGCPDLIAHVSRSKSGDHSQRRSRQDEALKGVSNEIHSLHVKVDDVLKAVPAEVGSLHLKIDEVATKQYEALKGVSGEIFRRLGRVEEEVQSLHGKLDLVIGMLGAAQSKSSSSLAPPARTISDESMEAAGRKRARRGHGHHPATSMTERKIVTSEESISLGSEKESENCHQSKAASQGSLGNDYHSHAFNDEETLDTICSPIGDFDIDALDVALLSSSERSNSNLDSDEEMKDCQRHQPQSGGSGHSHAFYDVQTLEECGSPLRDNADSCDVFDPDLRTPSAVPAAAGPSSEFRDPEIGIEPLPMTKDSLNSPVDVIMDGAAAKPDGGGLAGHPPRGVRKFVGRHRTTLLSGLMLSMGVVISVGTSLSTGARHAALTPSAAPSHAPSAVQALTPSIGSTAPPRLPSEGHRPTAVAPTLPMRFTPSKPTATPSTMPAWATLDLEFEEEEDSNLAVMRDVSKKPSDTPQDQVDGINPSPKTEGERSISTSAQ